jgi:hypothetical protein
MTKKLYKNDKFIFVFDDFNFFDKVFFINNIRALRLWVCIQK